MSWHLRHSIISKVIWVSTEFISLLKYNIAWSSNELQWLDLTKVGYQKSSPSNRHQGNTPYCIMWFQHLTHWGSEKMDVISQTTFSGAFSWMKIFELRLKFNWSLFLRVHLTIFQHWFRLRLGAEQATCHYLNQCWLDHWRIYASLGLNELNRNIIMLTIISSKMLHAVKLTIFNASGEY